MIPKPLKTATHLRLARQEAGLRAIEGSWPPRSGRRKVGPESAPAQSQRRRHDRCMSGYMGEMEMGEEWRMRREEKC
jgi:hypothetical protein